MSPTPENARLPLPALVRHHHPRHRHPQPKILHDDPRQGGRRTRSQPLPGGVPFHRTQPGNRDGRGADPSGAELQRPMEPLRLQRSVKARRQHKANRASHDIQQHIRGFLSVFPAIQLQHFIVDKGEQLRQGCPCLPSGPEETGEQSGSTGEGHDVFQRTGSLRV